MENYDKLVEYFNYGSDVSSESINNDNFAQLYKERKYYQILSIISVEESNPSIRLILALTLFQLGRYKAALRELAIAIELEVDPEDRSRLIKYQIKLFSLLKLNRTQPCFEELGVGIEQTTGDIVIETDLRDSNRIPIHLQAYEYEKYGKLNELSIGKVSISIDKLTQESLNSFDSKSKDPLVPLFKAINLFGPSYLYQPIAQNSRLYKNYINDQINKYPEIDLSIDIKPLTKMLIRVSSNSNNFLVNLIIKLQYIQGYLQLVNNNHYEASYHYLWLLNFFEILQKKLPGYFNKTEYFNDDVQRYCVYHLGHCIQFGNLDQSVFTLENLMLKSANCIPNTPAEFFGNRLWKLFFCHGVMLEELALKNKSKVLVGDSVLERFDSLNIERMVRQYIQVVCYKPQDDPTILQVIDRIIWGLFVYGGIPYETVWYFLRVRNYYQVKFDLGPLQTDEKIFATYHTYSNMGQILDRFSDLQAQLVEEDTWDLAQAEVFLVPILFKYGDTLVPMETYLDERSLYYDSKNFTMDEKGVYTKLKTHCKMNNKLVRFKYELGKELILSFCGAYMQYHGELPQELEVTD